jgi:hypothetical protein
VAAGNTSAGFLSGIASRFSGPADALSELVAQADRERLAYIHRAWRYYQGGMPGMLNVRPGEVDDNVRTNPVGMLVDALTSYLLGEHLDLALKVDDPEGDERQAYVDEVWNANARMALLGDLRTNGGISGHAYLKLHVRAGQMVRLEPPRMTVVDSANVSVITAEDDASLADAYIITWTVMRDGKPLAKRQRIERDGLGWSIVDEESSGTSNRWRHVDTIAWPYPWPPIFDCKNLPHPNSYYGSPDMSDQALDLVDAINASASNGRRVGRLHGHPRVYATGIADIVDLGGGPEDALVLPDEATIGVLAPPSTVDQHLALMAKLEQVWHKEVSLPEIAAGRLDGVGDLSGLALRILYAPTLRRVGSMRGYYGAMLDRVATEPRWPEVVPADPKAEGESAQALQVAGVSKRTTLEQMGYDPDVEAERTQMEREDAATGNLGAELLRFNAGGPDHQ